MEETRKLEGDGLVVLYAYESLERVQLHMKHCPFTSLKAVLRQESKEFTEDIKEQVNAMFSKAAAYFESHVPNMALYRVARLFHPSQVSITIYCLHFS